MGGWSTRLENGTVEPVIQDFVKRSHYTFGDNLVYIGTTTSMESPPEQIRDIDIMIIFKDLNESHISHVWRIVSNLHDKYNIIIDARIYSENDIDNIPIINKYLLKKFLNDKLGGNPFIDFSAPPKELEEECYRRIREMERAIISIMPRIPGDTSQVKTIGQCVYDAIRAFLILEGNPIASKEETCRYIEDNYPRFAEVKKIYDGYLDPHSILDIRSYILDSLAVVKHLPFISEKRDISNSVLLINTPSSLLPHPRDDYLSYDSNMPLGLVCIASYLNEKGIDISVLDSYAENLGVLSTIDRIFQMDPLPKIVGINTSSPNIHIVHRIALYIKRIREDIMLVCGGPHATLAPEHTLGTGDVDYIIAGEGEIPFADLVIHIFNDEIEPINAIEGVIRQVDGGFEGNINTVYINLEELPFPDLSVLPLHRYFDEKQRIYIHTSRGCAFNCIFCSVTKFWGGKVREIPTATLVNHLEESINRYDPKEVHVVDDNFSHHDGKMIRAFCEEINNRELRFRWKCQARADQLDEEVIQMMAKNGCFEVDLGIESGNIDIQKYIRKGLDLNKSAEIIKLLDQNGIKSKAFIMLGFPNEDYNSIADTINYSITLKENGLQDVAFFPVMPFPGTDISDECGETVYQGAIIDRTDVFERSFAADRLRKYSAKPEVSLNNLFTPDQLRFLVKFAYNRFLDGTNVEDLESEFNEYLTQEEDYLYGI
jgi:radical SAM superfamily enzyme YgiQ (UPF0313 family)